MLESSHQDVKKTSPTTVAPNMKKIHGEIETAIVPNLKKVREGDATNSGRPKF